MAEEWVPVRLAVSDGTLCDLRFRDCLGHYDVPGPYFLHDDGHWYRVDPPMQLGRQPTHFRPGTYDLPPTPSPQTTPPRRRPRGAGALLCL